MIYTYSPLSTILKNLDTRLNLYANVKLQSNLNTDQTMQLKYNRSNNATCQGFFFRQRTEEISLTHSNCRTNLEFNWSLGKPVIQFRAPGNNSEISTR